MRYSVLMTVFEKDNPDYFKLSLDSMLNQTIQADEIVIVKDGPITKQLQNIIEIVKLSCLYNIIEVQLPINLGLGKALNEGIKHCNNELIARMDADDYSLPNRCELQLNKFKENPKLDIVGCLVDEFIGDINNVVGKRRVPILNNEIYAFAKRRDPFNHPTVMYRKSLLEKVGYYSGYRKNQDTDLWIKCLEQGAVCENLVEDVFRFRFDENTYSKRKNWANTQTLIEIRYKAWQRGFSSFSDFIVILVAQLGIYLLPIQFQRIVYKKILRK